MRAVAGLPPPPRADPHRCGAAAASPDRHHADLPEGEAGGLLAEREEDQEAEFPGLRRAVSVRRRPWPRGAPARQPRRLGGRRPRGAAAPGWGWGRVGAAPGSAVACSDPRAFCARCVMPFGRLPPGGPRAGGAGWCPPGSPLRARGDAAGLARLPLTWAAAALREARSVRVWGTGTAAPRNFCLLLAKGSRSIPREIVLLRISADPAEVWT